MKSFKDNVVVVTGAANGIGRAIARAFAGEGARLVLVDIDADCLKEAVAEISAGGGTAGSFQADVADPYEMEGLAEAVLTSSGRVDILVNNAGVALSGEAKDLSLEDWHWIVGINYWGVIHGLHFFLPSMVDRRAGHVVNISSAFGLFGFPLESAYASTKFAVVGLSRALRSELRRFGIGVTVVCPGLTRTGILDTARSRTRDDFGRDLFKKRQGLLNKKGADPGEIAAATLSAVRKNRAVVKTPPLVSLMDGVHRFLPGFSNRVVESVYNG